MKTPVRLGPAAITPGVCVLLLSAQVAFGGLEKYSSFVVADKDAHASGASGAIRVTYLGVNGFQFETDGHALLVDPYFTRIGLWSAALNQQIESSTARVTEGLDHVRPRIDAILVTHAHFDHLIDVPEIMRRTQAKLFAGETAVHLTESLGILPNQCDTVRPGTTRKIGPWKIRVLPAEHDRLFGKVPFERCPKPSGTAKRPLKVSDWCVGEPLAFVIEAAGKRIYIDSGGVPNGPSLSRIKHVDLAILGVALPDSRQRFVEVVRQMRPRYTLPSHQDDMFGPPSHGFIFGKMTNFPQLAREYERERLPGRLILLDYFHPWTLR